MGAISYGPTPAVLAGVAVTAKAAGFRKFGRRFRRGVEGGHGLVLVGEEGSTYDGHREAHWYLYVCHRSWADVYQAAWDRPAVADPLKFDPNSHAVARFDLKGRESGKHPGFAPDDPKDVEDYVRHVHAWFDDTALPMAFEWLENPSLILEQLNVRRGPFNRHPDTNITMGLNGMYEGLIAIVLAAEIGDVTRAQEDFANVLRASESNPGDRSRWVEPLRNVLIQHGVDVPSL